MIVERIISLNDERYFVRADVSIHDESFDHAYGTERVYVPYIDEIKVFIDDKEVDDEKIIDAVIEKLQDKLNSEGV